ncbi:SGNH/GDSL hydrolase family protein [Mycoplasmopsis gallopavonis]|uniref:Uncharacterized protein n=1 Tax=Mycoplasmopsis gallopavonis TaxID=76629 RepID=A0A449B0B0_9BACT|nr:SGNH/GDSL hydrolase family protein [Mycoplasmopsis gallopavonis]VEU73174.1 Uncharacterised protein [Mycoplasmopsis gallopavonis]
MALAWIGASAAFVSCAAPGSSRPLPKGDGDVILDRPTLKNDVETLPTDIIHSVDPGFESGAIVIDPSKINNSKNTQRNISPKLIRANQKINYVALGDSITAGFDGTLPQDYPGSLIEGKIEGASYPAFLARILNVNNRVSQFNNYAVSGSTILDWMRFLGIDYQTTEGRYHNILETSYSNPQTKKAEILANLKNANLITFTLGANDFFYLIFESLKNSNFFELIDNLTSNSPSYQKAAEYISEIYEKTLPEVKKRLAHFISNLKLLAPNANINLVSYPTPFLGLKEIFDRAFSGILGSNLKISIMDQIVSFLNSNLIEIASKYDVNYVDAYNPTYWNKEYRNLSSIFLDIHPNTRAYKKMAMDIYLKITNSKLALENYSYDSYDFTTSFINSDSASLSYQIETNVSPINVLGFNTTAFLNKETTFEQELNILRNSNNFSNRILQLVHVFKDISLDVIELLLTNSFYLKVDPEQKLHEILFTTRDGVLVAEDLINQITDSGILSDIINQIQTNLEDLAQRGKLNISTLFNAFKDAILQERYIYQIVNAFASSKFITENKSHLKEVLDEISSNVFKVYGDKLVKLITELAEPQAQKVLGVSKQQLTNLLNLLIFENPSTKTLNTDFINLTHLLINTFVDNSQNFENVENLKDLLSAFINDPNFSETRDQLNRSEFVAKFSLYVKNILRKLLKEQPVQDFVSTSLTNFLSKNNLLKNEKEQADFKNLLGNLLVTINNSNEADDLFEFVQEFIASFLEGFPITPNNELGNLAQDSLTQAANKQFKDPEQLLGIIKLLSKAITDNQSPEQVVQNKEIIKTLVTNFLQSEKLGITSLINALLPSPAKNAIEEYVGQENFNNLILIIAKNKNLTTIVNYLVQEFIDKLPEINGHEAEIQNLGDFVKFMLVRIDLAPIENPLRQILTSLLDDPNFQNVLKKILQVSFESLQLDPQLPKYSSLINDLATNLGKILRNLDILDPFFDRLFALLREIKNEANLDVQAQKLKEIPSILTDLIVEKVKPNPLDFIKKVLEFDIIDNNKQAWVDLLTKIYDKFAHGNFIYEIFISFVRPELEKYADYINPGEVEQILKNIMTSDEITQSFSQILEILINDRSWIDALANKSSFEEIANVFLKLTNFKEKVILPLKPLIIKSLKEEQYTKTLIQLLDYLAKEQGFDLNLDRNYDSLNLIVSTLVSYAQQNNLIEKVVTYLFNALENGSDVNEIKLQLQTTWPTLLSEIDILGIIKHVIQDLATLNDRNQNNLVEFAIELYQQFINHANFETWINQIPVQALNLSQVSNQTILDLIKTILKDPDFTSILRTTFKSILSNSILGNGNWETPLDFVVAILKDSHLISEIQEPLKNILNKNLLENDANDNFILELILSSIQNQAKLTPYLKNVSLDKQKELLNSSLVTVKFIVKEYGLIDLVLEALSDYANDSKSDTLNDLVAKILAKIQTKLESLDLSQESFKILQKFLATTNVDSELKETLKQIFSNAKEQVLANLTTESISKVINSLPASIQTELNKYLSVESLSNLLKIILNNQSFENILSNVITKIVDNLEAFKEPEVNSWTSFAQKVLKIVDLQTFKTDIHNLLDELLNLNDLQNVVSNLILELLQTHLEEFYLQNVEPSKKFARITSQNFKKLLKDLGFYDLLIDQSIDFLDKLKTSDNLADEIAKYPQFIANQLLELLKTDGQYDLGKIKTKLQIALNSPIFSQNKTYLINLFKYLFAKESSKQKLREFLTNLVNSNSLPANLNDYLDSNELINVINFVVDNEDLDQLIYSFVDIVFNHTDLIFNSFQGDIFDVESFIFQLLKKHKYLKTNLEAISGLAISILNNNFLDNSLAKTLNKILKDQGLITSDLPNSFASDLRTTVLNLLKSNSNNPFVVRILNKIANLLDQANITSFAQLKDSLVSDLSEFLNFQDFSLIKELLNSPIFQTNNLATLKEIAHKAFTKYLAPSELNLLLNKVDSQTWTNIASKVGLTATKLKELIQKEYAKEETQSVINNLIDLLLEKLTASSNNSFKQANSFNDLIKAFFAQNDLTELIRPRVIQIINDFIANPDTKTFFKTTLKNLLKAPEASKYFAGVSDSEIDSLSSNLVEIYFNIDSVLSLTNVAYDSLVAELAKNGISLNVPSIISSVFGALQKNLSQGQGIEQNVLALIRAIANAKLFQQNKDTLIKIIKNAYDSLDLNSQASSILDKLPANIKAEISNYIEPDKLDKLLKDILSSSQFKNVFIDTITSVISHMNEYEHVQSIGELVQITLKNLHFEELRDNLIALVNLILHNEQITDLLKSFLNQTLKTYHVEVTASDVQKLINDLAYEGANFLGSLDIFEKIIRRVFDEIQNASTSQEQLAQAIKNLPTIIKDMLTGEFSQNLVDIANRIFKLSAIQNNKSALQKVIVQLIKGLHQGAKDSNSSQIIKWLEPSIRSIQNPIFDTNVQQALIAALNEVFNNQSLYDVLNLAVGQVLNEPNLNFLSNLDNPFLILKHFTAKTSFIASLKTNFKKLLVSTFKQTNGSEVSDFTKFISSLIFKTLNVYGLDQGITQIPNKDKLISDVLFDWGNFIDQTNAYDKLFDALINTINNSSNLNEFSSKIGANILQSFDFANDFSLIKKFINLSTNVAKNSETWNKIARNLIANFLSKNQYLTKILGFANFGTKLASYEIAEQDFVQVITNLMQNRHVKNLISETVSHIILHFDDFKQANSYNDLLKILFSDQTFNANLVSLVTPLVDVLLANAQAQEMIGKVAYHGLLNSEYNELLSGMNKIESIRLFGDLIGIFKAFDSHLNLLNPILKASFDELGNHGKDFEVASLINVASTQFNLFFGDSQNLEANLLKLLKTLLTSEKVLNNQSALKKFIHNIISYFIKHYDFGQMIWDQIPQQTQEFILLNFVNNQNNNGLNVFKNIINEFIRVPESTNLISNLISFIISNPQVINRASRFTEILQAYLATANNELQFKRDLKTFLLGALKTNSFKVNAEYLIHKFLEFLGVQTDSEINLYINVLANNVYAGIDRLGVLDNLINSLISVVKKPNQNLQTMIETIKNNLFASLQLTDYETFKKFLRDPLLIGSSVQNGQTINHKSAVRKILHGIIGKFLTQKDKIKQIASDLKLAKLIFDQEDDVSVEIVNNTIVSFVNNEKLKRVLDLIIDDILDRTDQYLSKTTWYGALNVLLNKPSSNSLDSLKTNLKGWIMDIVNNNQNNDFYRGLARILITKMKASNWNLSILKDEALFESVIKGLVVTVVNSNQFDWVFEQIYTNLKNTNFEATNNPSAAFSQAIMDGVLSLIRVNKSKQISLDKLLNQKDLIEKILTKIGDANYVKFINRLFEASKYSYTSTNNGKSGHFNAANTTGIYEFIRTNLVEKNQPSAGGSSGGGGTSSSGSSEATGVKFDVNIFNVVSKAQNFFKVFFKPIYRELIKKVTTNQYSSEYQVKYKLTDEYKALFRLYTLLLWYIGDGVGYDSAQFWNIGIDIQAMVNKGAAAAFDESRDANKKAFDQKLRKWYKTMGAKSNGWYNDEFVQGNRSTTTTYDNYWADQLLAYIYYLEKPKDRHSSRTIVEVLLDALNKGYLKNPQ